MNMFHHLYVGIDIGSHHHQVAICDGEVKLVDEFTIAHDASGFEHFFGQLASLHKSAGLSVRSSPFSPVKVDSPLITSSPLLQ